MPESAISSRDLAVHYGEVCALSGFDFECPRGSGVAILGANAAGKSSVLLALAGLLPAAGEIQLLGKPAPMRASHRIASGLCLVPEQRQVFPNLTVEENLLLGAYRAPGGREQRAHTLAEVLALFPSLAGRINVAAGMLSGGEQQMLAIGRGLMAHPKVLLMDEPTLGLAPRVAADIAAAISALAGRLDGLVIAEQNAAWALELCQTAYVLERGAVALHGASDDVAGDPRLNASYLGGE